MANRLYNYLTRKTKIQRLARSDEYKYFLATRKLFLKYNIFTELYNVDDEFELFKANIILKSLENKEAIETKLDGFYNESMLEYKAIKHHIIRDKMNANPLELPYLLDGQDKIYIPLFPRALNLVYREEADKLLDFPYNKIRTEFSSSLIDPFETYNYALFNSFFTKLVKLQGDKTSMAFYHYDYQAIYIINDQGRLDVKIPLFDKAMRQPNSSHIMERIQPVIAAYFANDKKTFIQELRKNRLISSKMYRKLTKKAILGSIQQARKIRKG
ncbi:MAG: hypothetical protein NTV44_03980 [Firmicutes bacterium]|nr:hypothetical protein [Bacillota bacterium]